MDDVASRLIGQLFGNFVVIATAILLLVIGKRVGYWDEEV